MKYVKQDHLYGRFFCFLLLPGLFALCPTSSFLSEMSREKSSPSPLQGNVFVLHPAQARFHRRGGRYAAYCSNRTLPIDGFDLKISCWRCGSTASVREAPQARVLASDNVPTMILFETQGLQLF